MPEIAGGEAITVGEMLIPAYFLMKPPGGATLFLAEALRVVRTALASVGVMRVHNLPSQSVPFGRNPWPKLDGFMRK